jgi:high affinity Mn2+ porin
MRTIPFKTILGAGIGVNDSLVGVGVARIVLSTGVASTMFIAALAAQAAEPAAGPQVTTPTGTQAGGGWAGDDVAGALGYLNRKAGSGAARRSADAASETPAAPWPTKAKPLTKSFDWSGWYVGAHVGITTGSSKWSTTQTGGGGPNLNGSFDLPFKFDFMAGTGSYVAGLQGGYNVVLPSRLMLGFELDETFPNSDVSLPPSIAGSQTVSAPLLGQATYAEVLYHSGTARGRIGYAADNWLLYGTAGFAWSYDTVTRTQIDAGITAPGTVDTRLLWRLGWAAGAGFEIALSQSWSVKVEYLYTGFGASTVTFSTAGQQYTSDLALQSFRLGLNYHIGDDTDFGFLAHGPSALETANFAFHGQATYVNQYSAPFPAPYSGPNSLAANIGRETTDVTLYAGMRLWQGAELWVNPEIDQGFGLSGSLGVAGFPSAEAYKVGADYPYVRLQRAFVRQTIDLGGDVQKLDPGLNQFSGSQTEDRLVLTVGKFGTVDVFDTNKYSHDPRTSFLNWALADTATFDYAADAWGYTVGAAAEWYQGPWTLRAGVFDLSAAPNQSSLDPQFGQFQSVGEIERRYDLGGQPGKVAVTGFLTRGRMGSFEDAIQLAALTGGPADIAAVRQYNSRGGVSMNLEQQLAPYVGLFVRAGVANGDFEPFDFTDVDRTVAGGVVMSGKLWGRDDDTFGFAGVINGITPVHQAFLNAGGLGILVGDGMLPNPGDEKIIETYYSFPVFSTKVTLDYQLIENPGYNRDRGPVSVFGLRLHAEY